MICRRQLLKSGGASLVGLFPVPRVFAGGTSVDIRMKSDPNGARVWFDPIGALVSPGTTVRWFLSENVHTATAYHPSNDNHALRMPADAVPWDSGYLVNPGDTFSVTLMVEGVYDYFCAPHEPAGMVGRLVVAKDARRFRFGGFAVDGASARKPIPPAALRNFPPVEKILSEKIVRAAPFGRKND